MHAVEPGFVIAEGLDDSPVEVDSTTAVHVQRPDGQIWVAPGSELGQIHDYVADVVIPTLLTGSGASPGTFRVKSRWMTPGIPTSNASQPAIGAGAHPMRPGGDGGRR